MSEFHDSENSGAVDDPPVYPQSSTNQVVMSHIDIREDLFVDAPDELNIASATSPIVEAKPNTFGSEIDNNDSSRFIDELEHLRASLDRAVDEKEKLKIKYKEEMEVFAREIHLKDQVIEGLNAKVMSYAAEDERELYAEKNRKCEVAMERISTALGSVVDQRDVWGDSGGDQIDIVEKSTLALIDKYNRFLFEVDQLRQCLTKTEYGFGMLEFGTIFIAARDELFELRRKEAELVGKIGLLEDENGKLLQQVENEKVTMEMLNSELEKTKTEVEQEKTKCANTKEKLNLAVTKGKSLVQQRDALKQSLADSTSELNKCLVELGEKTSALEATESRKEELVKSENLVASLQESLSEKTLILETLEHILSHLDVPQELQSVDIVGRTRWLANERKELKRVSLDFYRLKDTICAIDLPKNASFSDLDSRLACLKESFYQAKDEINMLQNEMSRTKEAASDEKSALISTIQQEKDYIKEELDHLRIKNDEIVAKAVQIALEKDHISDSLAAELTEKNKIQKELDDLTNKYENVVEKVHQLSSEKDHVFQLLVEGSGKVMGDQDGIEVTSNLPMLIDRCLEKIKGQTSPSMEAPFEDAELSEKHQSLLYVRDMELMLCKEILEEDMLVRSQLNDLSNQFRVTSQELLALKEEKDVLQKNLERSEEKACLLREKLTMAVKKGKELVQDRENLKVHLEEKKSEIEKLRLELQQEESRVAECREQISTLSVDLERIPKLESNLAFTKEEKDQLQKFLFESNRKLHIVVESIDGIGIPVDSAFLEPVEKLNLLAGYIDDCQTAKTQTEQQLREVKEEASNLAGKLAEVQATMKFLEDALAVVKNDLSQIAEEKKEIEFGKKNVEMELQKAIEEAHSQTNKFAEACEARKSLKEALSLAENKISLLIAEKEEVQVSKAASEMEVEKVREEVTTQTSRLTEAYTTIKSLENALSLAEMTVASLTEQSNNAQVEITNLDNELKKLKNETETQISQLTDAGKTIKSLEDALVKAEADFTALLDEKRTADQEVSNLNSKLSACVEELAVSSGNLAGRSMELVGHLNNLQMLAKNQSLLSTMKQCFGRSLERLKDMDLTIRNTRVHLFDNDSELLQGYPLTEDIAGLPRQFSDDTDNTLNIEMENDEANAINADDVSSCLRKVTKLFQMQNKILADRFECISSFLDESLAAMLRKLQATEDEIKSMPKNKESLNQEYGQKEWENLTSKYERVVEKVNQLSLEKDQMVQLLVEGAGIVLGGQEGMEENSSNLPMLIDRCIGQIKKQANASLETPFVDAEIFEKIQSLLYVKDLKLMLCEEILEEDMSVRLQLNDLSNQFRVTFQENFALKEEKDVLQKDLEQSEEKAGLLREKLSMAVKKGKGIVQDREKLKVLLEEKKSEIEKLRLDLQREESRVAEFREQISTLSVDLERIPKLESNLASTIEEKDQLQKFLFESNRKLHSVVESIDGIGIPVDSSFLEPVEKLNLLAGYIDDCQTAKTQTEQQLREVKEEASNLAGQLAEVQATMKFLEDALVVVKNDLSQIAEEKKEIEFGKKNVEMELQKAIEEAHSQNNKFVEACEARKSLEEALSLAENKISLLIGEKEEVQGSKAASEMEVEKVREEVTTQTSRLTEAYTTIKSLENALSLAEMTVASLTEQSNNAQVEITNLDNELKKLKNETETQTSQLTDAGKTIKSLEDALVKAETDFSELLGEKRTADQDVSNLNSKLSACVEELAGHLNNLQMLAKDQSLLSTMKQCFDRSSERLKDMDLTIRNTRVHLFDKDSELLQGYSLAEDIASLPRQFSDDTDNTLNIEMENDEANEINADDVSSCFRKVTKLFQLQNKILADRFECISSFLDESLAAMLRKLQATEDEIKSMAKNKESSKQEYDQKELENLTSKYERVVEKVNQLSLQKDQMVQLLVEGSGIVLGDQEGIEEDSSNLPMLIDRCIGHIKEQTNASLETPFVDAEIFEKFQSLLYVRDLRLMLCEEILEEDMLVRLQLNDLSNQFRVTSQENFALKEEKDVLQRDLEQSEEKSGLLREKLSMAVKKGKGIVQEREKLKVLLEEKKSEIEKLRLDLQREESRVAECREQISTLSVDLERVPKLESNLASTIEEKDQLQKLLFESNKKLRSVVESIDGIGIPVDSAFLEPVEKLNLLAEYIDDCQAAKTQTEQELREVKEEASILAGKLAEAHATIKSLEDSLVVVKNDLSQIAEEKKEIEIGKNNVEIKLHKAIEEKDVSQSRVSKLESYVGALEDSCREGGLKIEEYQAKEDIWKEKEAELLSSYNSLLMKEKEVEEPFLSGSQSKTLLEKLSGMEIPDVESEDLEPHSSAHVRKLFSVIGSFSDLQNQIDLLSNEKDELQSTLSRQRFEIELLKEEIETHVRNKPNVEQMKTELSEVTFGLEKIIVVLGGKEFNGDKNSVGIKTLLPVLEKQVNALVLESENSKSKAEELGAKLAGSEKIVNDLSTKVKLLEDSIHGRTALPEIVQERSIFEAPSASTGSEISEIEDPGSFGKNTIPSVPVAPQVRTMRKASTDHLALNIDLESDRLISNKETDEQKGHLFKSLNTSGLIPKPGKLVADRVDGIWVSSGQVLSSRPRARLSLIAYCLLLHIWLLGTIL